MLIRTMGLVGSLLLASILALAGCDDDSTSSQMSAREEVVQHTCDRAQGCGLIGAGLTYQNRDDCQTRAAGTVQTAWPPADCDGRIDETQFRACLAGIDAIQCESAALDAVSLFTLGACAKSRVCSATPE